MKRAISVIGVPMDLGQMRRGVDMGPTAMRHAGMIERLSQLDYEVKDLGDLRISRPSPGTDLAGVHLNSLSEIAEASEELGSLVSAEIESGRFPLIVGGDHSIAIGSLAGIAKHYDNLGVIWYDAHGDLNTPDTSPSGNVHGMPLAASLGLGHDRLTQILGYAPKIQPEHVVIIGARSLDPGEKELIRELGMKVYTMHDVDLLGMPHVIQEALEHLKVHADGVHLSVDLDALDPMEAPGVGTPVAGGLSYRESHLAMEMLYDSGLVTSAEFVEVNPILDERNKTAELAVGLMESLFGDQLK